MVGGRISAFCVVFMLAGGCLSVASGTSGGNGGQTSGSAGNGASGGQTNGSPSNGASGGQTAGSTGRNSGWPCMPTCGVNATCNADGTCTCYPNYTSCPGDDGGSACVQVELDNDNCGGCSLPCPTGTRCLGAECVCELTTCVDRDGGVTCTDVESDPLNCGSCNSPCAPGQKCTLNECD